MNPPKPQRLKYFPWMGLYILLAIALIYLVLIFDTSQHEAQHAQIFKADGCNSTTELVRWDASGLCWCNDPNYTRSTYADLLTKLHEIQAPQRTESLVLFFLAFFLLTINIYTRAIS